MKQLFLFVAAVFVLSSTLSAQDFVGRWTGTADTVDEVGTKRTETSTIDIKMVEGKVTASRVNRNGSSSPVEVHQSKTKINLVETLKQEGGDEFLRWKFELKDEKLVGMYVIVHDNPEKWQYDRQGAMTLSKVEVAKPSEPKAVPAK